MIRKASAALIGFSLAASPASAAHSPSSTSLSITQASVGGDQGETVRRRGVPGGGVIAAVILAAVVGVGVLLATQDDKADSA